MNVREEVNSWERTGLVIDHGTGDTISSKMGGKIPV